MVFQNLESFFETVLEVCQSENDFSSAGKVIYYTQYFCYPLPIEDQKKEDFNPFETHDQIIPDETEEVDLLGINDDNGKEAEIKYFYMA